MSPDIIRESGSAHEARSQLPKNISEKLDLIGIALTSEIFDRIRRSGREEDLKKDLTAVSSNPTEKERFEQLWLKGFWQVVNIDGKEMTFAEIAGMDGIKRAALQTRLDNTDPDTAEDLKSFLKKAANQSNEGKLKIEQAANQSNEKKREELLRMDKDLSAQVTELQSINWVPTPPLAELEKNAANIPELRWANPEDIQSGKYNNILLADYYVRNATEIGKNLSDKDKKQFQESINSLSSTLWRQPFEILTKKLVLWENREKVESAWKELIKSGYNKDVVWNPQERTITFINSKWEKRIIETARVPPMQRIEDGAVELTSTLPEKQENPHTKMREKQEQDILSSLDKWSRLPLIGWKEVQSAPTVLEKLQRGISVLDTNTKSITQALKDEEESAKKSGIEWDTPQIKEYKKLLISIEALRAELVGKWSQLVIIHTQELSEGIWTSSEISMDIWKENLNNISKTGLGRFRNMDEVSSFLSTVNNPIFGNNFSDRETINNYLTKNKLTSEQLFSIFQKIVELYGKIVGDKTLGTLSKDEKYALITKQDEDGKTSLENALNSERINNDNRTLTKWDFERILSLSES